MAEAEVWAGTVVDFLGSLSEAAKARVLEGSRVVAMPAGSVFEYGAELPGPDVVGSGILRLFQVAGDGRQASLSYMHRTELAGGMVVMGQASLMHCQAVTELSLVRLDGARLRQLVDVDVEVARVFAVHLAGRLARAFRVIAVRSFGNIRERLAYDFLDRACVEQIRTGSLTFKTTHEELADAIGTSREVVSRAIGELRRAGIVATTPGRVAVTDPERLAVIVSGLVT